MDSIIKVIFKNYLKMLEMDTKKKMPFLLEWQLDFL